jgi:uncharacterized C2H2 Zn-finger protein
MRYKFKHSDSTLYKYDCKENRIVHNKAKKIGEEDGTDLFQCPYCGQFYDNGHSRFFETVEITHNDIRDLIDMACKPCLWKLGVRYCIHGDKIFGKGAC